MVFVGCVRSAGGELVDQFIHRNAAVRRYFLPGDRNRAVGDKTDVLLRRPGIGFPASGGPLFDAGIVVDDRDSLMAHLSRPSRFANRPEILAILGSHLFWPALTFFGTGNCVLQPSFLHYFRPVLLVI